MEKGSRNLRKPEIENISLYATLQEPEFRCFTLYSQVLMSICFAGKTKKLIYRGEHPARLGG
jgi:hypothetical protein